MPSLQHISSTLNIDLESHILSQLLPTSGRFTNNNYFNIKVSRKQTTVPKNSGNGLFAYKDLPAFTIIGIHTGGEILNISQVNKSTSKSDYVVHVRNLVRDGYNRRKEHSPAMLSASTTVWTPQKPTVNSICIRTTLSFYS